MLRTRERGPDTHVSYESRITLFDECTELLHHLDLDGRYIDTYGKRLDRAADVFAQVKKRELLLPPDDRARVIAQRREKLKQYPELLALDRAGVDNRAAVGGDPGSLPFVTIADLAERSDPSSGLGFHCEAWIPHGLTFLAGKAGSGKSSLAYAIARALSRENGTAFGGLATTTSPVLFLQLEEPQDLAVERMQREDLRDNSRVLVLDCFGDDPDTRPARQFDLASAEYRDRLVESACAIGQEFGERPVIIIDSFAKATLGLESDAWGDRGRIAYALDDLAKEKSVSFLVIAHPRKRSVTSYRAKQAEHTIDDLCGSHMLGAAASAVLHVEDVGTCRRVSCLKLRHVETPAPSYFEITPDGVEWHTAEDVGRSQLTGLERDVEAKLRTLGSGEWTATDVGRLFAPDLSGAEWRNHRKKVARVLDKLVADGLIDQASTDSFCSKPGSGPAQ